MTLCPIYIPTGRSIFLRTEGRRHHFQDLAVSSMGDPMDDILHQSEASCCSPASVRAEMAFSSVSTKMSIETFAKSKQYPGPSAFHANTILAERARTKGKITRQIKAAGLTKNQVFFFFFVSRTFGRRDRCIGGANNWPILCGGFQIPGKLCPTFGICATARDRPCIRGSQIDCPNKLFFLFFPRDRYRQNSTV